MFAGNTHDSRTLQTIVATMEARHGALGRVWIADRGMATRVTIVALGASNTEGWDVLASETHPAKL